MLRFLHVTPLFLALLCSDNFGIFLIEMRHMLLEMQVQGITLFRLLLPKTPLKMVVINFRSTSLVR